MKETRILMGMPITVEIVDRGDGGEAIAAVFSYFDYVDGKFSTYKEGSEISRINRGEIKEESYSDDMREVFALAKETEEKTGGYFSIVAPGGKRDPSGLVKGWAIRNASKLLEGRGFENFYIEAGGDIQAHGENGEGRAWSVGIRNPFNIREIVKVIFIREEGVATSGTYIRGQHVYNPFRPETPITEIVSITVIGPNIYEADRFATAALAMSGEGIRFIEGLEGFEGYSIGKDGIATMTSGFGKYTLEPD